VSDTTEGDSSNTDGQKKIPHRHGGSLTLKTTNMKNNSIMLQQEQSHFCLYQLQKLL